MRITIDLSTEEAIALRRFAHQHHTLSIEEAAALVLWEYLIGTGDLELAPAIEEDSQVEGNA
jgi:hypothetical protein